MPEILFVEGDHDLPLTGTVVGGDLTGATVVLRIQKPDGSILLRTAAVTNAAAGEWSYTWQPGELVPGRWLVDVETTYASTALQTSPTRTALEFFVRRRLSGSPGVVTPVPQISLDLSNMTGLDAAVASSTAAAAADKTSPIRTALSTAYEELGDSVTTPKAAKVTRGLYSRAIPTTSGTPMYAVCADPSIAGRVWAVRFGVQIGYTDDGGATFFPKGTAPAQTVRQVIISTNYMWVLISAASSMSGSLWRSPRPDANGDGIVLTKQFDLTGMVNGLGGAGGDGRLNTSFREGSLAVSPDESNVYLLDYGAGTTAGLSASVTDCAAAAGSDVVMTASAVTSAFTGSLQGKTVTLAGAGAAGATLTATVLEIFASNRIRLSAPILTSVVGATLTLTAQSAAEGIVDRGPQIHRCAAPSAASMVFTHPFEWGWAKHGHALQIINGVLWASLGDYQFPSGAAYAVPPRTQVGLWSATSAAATTWTGFTAGPTSPYEPIDIIAATIDGAPVIIGESDSREAVGPLIYQKLTASTVGQCRPAHLLPEPFTQTMRCIYLTARGDLMWLGTGELGAVGPYDAIWISKPPYTTPVLLEKLTLGTVQVPRRAVAEGTSYVWFGSNRIRVEEFPD